MINCSECGKEIVGSPIRKVVEYIKPGPVSLNFCIDCANIEEKKLDLIRKLSNPISNNPQEIELRALWLSVMVGIISTKVQEEFCKDFHISVNEERVNKLFFELYLLFLVFALDAIRNRFENSLKDQTNVNVENLFEEHVLFVVLGSLGKNFETKDKKEIFDDYCAYGWLRNDCDKEIHNQSESDIVRFLNLQIKMLHKVDNNTLTKEQHFSERVCKILNGVDKELVAMFAKEKLFLRGFMLGVDAFGEEIDKIKEFLRNTKELWV